MKRIPIKTHGALEQHFTIEPGEAEAHIHSSQDVTRILDENARLSTAERKGTTTNGTAIAARVPVLYRYVKWPNEFEAKHGVHPDKLPANMKPGDRMAVQAKWAQFYKGKLNSREFRGFRTDGGKRL